MRHYVRVAIIGAGGILAIALLVRGSLAGGVISIAASACVDWILGKMTGENES